MSLYHSPCYASVIRTTWLVIDLRRCRRASFARPWIVDIIASGGRRCEQCHDLALKSSPTLPVSFYEKDLGWRATDIALGMTSFDTDRTWRWVKPAAGFPIAPP